MLIALTAVALAVRLIGLNGGLWIDEISSLLQSFRTPLADSLTHYPADTHHPMYTVLARTALVIFGEHPWSIRLPAALFGAATVPLLYLLGTRVMSRRESLVAAALLAVSYHHAWFSQNARGYALLAFFAVAGAWLLLEAQATGRRRWYVLYAVAMALGSWTHLTMVFVCVGHAAAAALYVAVTPAARSRATILSLAGAFALAAALTVLLYAPMLGDVIEWYTNRPSRLQGISTPRWAAAETVRVMLVGLGGAGAAAAVMALLFGTLLMGAGALALARSSPLALGLFVFPGLVTMAGAFAARGTMYPRFFFALAGYLILIAVRGAFELARLAARGNEDRAMRLGTAAAGVLIALSALSLARLWRYPKQDFGGARQYVVDQQRPGDRVATVGVTVQPYRDYYQMPWSPVTAGAELDALRQGSRVWLVYAFPRYLARSAGEVLAVTERECGDAVAFPGTLGGGDVFVCLLEPRP